MSDHIASSVQDAVARLEEEDETLEWIGLVDCRLCDRDVDELMDALVDHPNVVTQVHLSHNQLTDETGVKLAKYLAVTSRLQQLFVSNNDFEEKTFRAIASALCTNTSLRELHMHLNGVLDTSIEDAFFVALQLNPKRPLDSLWRLASSYFNNFVPLEWTSTLAGPPSMLASLSFEIE